MGDRTRFSNTIALSEPSVDGVSSVQLLRAGSYSHPFYGTLDITSKMFGAMIRNFNSGARGIDVSVDLDHDGGESQGWFRGIWMNADETELWGDVEWTEPGRERVAGRLYRYMSIEYDAEGEVDGKKIGALMYGAALTNRPFIKGMEAVTLKEQDGGNGMSLEKIAAELGLEEGSDEERVYQCVAALVNAHVAARVQLTEHVAAVATLTEQNAALSERMSRLEAQRSAEAIQRLMEKGRLTPAMLDASDGHLRKYAAENLDGFVAFVESLPQVVAFGELGSSGGSGTENPSEVLDAAVKAQMLTAGCDYTEGIRLVTLAHPDLVRAYKEHVRNVV